MRNWADDLREAGLDPVRDWREWNTIRLTLEAWRGEIDTAELIRLSQALGAASKLTDFEHAYLPYMNPTDEDEADARPALKMPWSLPTNTPASIRQCEEPCPSCGKTMSLHPWLKARQIAHARGASLNEDHFEAHLHKLRNFKAMHVEAERPTYVCQSCDHDIIRSADAPGRRAMTR